MRAEGGVVVRDLHVIDALGVRLPVDGRRLARMREVRAVTPNAAMRPTAQTTGGRWADWNPSELATAYVHSTRAEKVWTDRQTPATGAGVAVAVIDTGIAGHLSDFRVSSDDPTSRVIASVVTNPDATTATDHYGHGTHVAGLVAGNGRALAPSDPQFNRYIGTAPEANLVSIKVSDDHGTAYLIHVIAGLQFVVDSRATTHPVVNLSLALDRRAVVQDDPLTPRWRRGVRRLVVVVAAGNAGPTSDAVAYAPANDPYAITVGGVDDRGTKAIGGRYPRPVVEPRASPRTASPSRMSWPRAFTSSPPWRRTASFRPWRRECVREARYFQVGGTSMAAPIVAGIAADILAVHPEWSPHQVKGALTYNSGTVNREGSRSRNVRPTSDGAWEVAADLAINASSKLQSNQGLTPSWFLDPVTGVIDYTRASWRRASWRTAIDGLRASWKAASWDL